MSIEDNGGLRVLAINILGRFLSNRDNNIRSSSFIQLNFLHNICWCNLPICCDSFFVSYKITLEYSLVETESIIFKVCAPSICDFFLNTLHLGFQIFCKRVVCVISLLFTNLECARSCVMILLVLHQEWYQKNNLHQTYSYKLAENLINPLNLARIISCMTCGFSAMSCFFCLLKFITFLDHLFLVKNVKKFDQNSLIQAKYFYFAKSDVVPVNVLQNWPTKKRYTVETKSHCILKKI